MSVLLAATMDPAAGAAPVISEFMAVNTATRSDQDGHFSDWIEIHNPDALPLDLGGWYLTDSASNRRRWTFPAVRLPAGGYLLVFASNKDRRDPAGELHTNFALASEGEYLALVRPDGVTVEWEYAPAYPPQTADVSYGVVSAAGGGTSRGYFATPTPGAPNAASADATLASPVRFAPVAGSFAAPFRLEISGAGAAQHLRYTAVFSEDLRSRGLARSALHLRREDSGPLGVGGWSTGLPVLVLALHGSAVPGRGEGEKPAWLLAYPGGTANSVPWLRGTVVTAPIRLAVRGSSSADFPKKSYNLDFVNDEGRATAVALPGLPAFDEWALVGPWRYDPALLRNAFVYALSNRLGRWAPRTQFVEVFVPSGSEPLDLAAYQGVYLLTDKLDLHPERIAIERVSEGATREPEISGGYLLKIGEPEAGEYHWSTEKGLDPDTISEVAVASPKLERLGPAQRDYIRGYVQHMEDALHAGRASGWSDRHYLDYLDRASWVDHHLLNTFAANPDAFERSAYFHKPRGGRVVAGPVWDFDRALGSPADPRSQRWDRWYGEDAVQPWHFGWWGILGTDPEFQQEWIDRWQSLRRDRMSDANLGALVDQLAALLGGEAAARDAQRWPGESGSGDGFAGEVRQLRDWILARAGWIDRQFVAPPVIRLRRRAPGWSTRSTARIRGRWAGSRRPTRGLRPRG
ncbi:MAG: CotH kinase family protein [Verrucomicrobia bacterium]|nr:CotH kinase family protein [Verrucomicrobiota bacterium]